MKLKKKSGFTLIEMLIVVAIIAILIAVSIPLVNNALERAREATDQANERSAKAEAVIVYLTADATDNVYKDLIAGTPVYYDAVTGKIVQSSGKPTVPYGKGTTVEANKDYDGRAADHTKAIIRITFTQASETFKIEWEPISSGG